MYRRQKREWFAAQKQLFNGMKKHESVPKVQDKIKRQCYRVMLENTILEPWMTSVYVLGCVSDLA